MEKKVRIVKDSEVKRIIIAPPSGEKEKVWQIMLMVELQDDSKIVFDHATVGNILRSGAWVLYHPQRKAIELVAKRLREEERKKGFAEDQLLETDREEEELIKEISSLLS